VEPVRDPKPTPGHLLGGGMPVSNPCLARCDGLSLPLSITTDKRQEPPEADSVLDKWSNFSVYNLILDPNLRKWLVYNYFVWKSCLRVEPRATKALTAQPPYFRKNYHGSIDILSLRYRSHGLYKVFSQNL
jgi:hypothetical protein